MYVSNLILLFTYFTIMVWCSYVPLIIHDFKLTSDLFSQAKGLVLAHDGVMTIVELIRIQSKLIIE